MKKTFLILVLLCGLMLTGCARLTSLSEGQSDVIAEYMAGSVLRYTDNYMEALVYPEESKDTKVTSDTASDTVNAANDNTKKQDTQAADSTNAETTTDSISPEDSTIKEEGSISYQEFYKIVSDSKYQIKYTGYKLCTSYAQRDNYFTLEPTDGKKLLTLSFKALNETAKTVKVNLGELHIDYKLAAKDGKSYSPMVTLLDTDLNYLNYSLKSNKSDEAILIFEVPESLATDGLSLSISLNGQKAIFDLNE